MNNVNYVSSNKLPISYNCKEDKTLLEINNAPITNIIVQQFEVCHHNQNPSIPGSYQSAGFASCNRGGEGFHNNISCNPYPTQYQAPHFEESSKNQSIYTSSVQPNVNYIPSDYINSSIPASSNVPFIKPEFISNNCNKSQLQINYPHSYLQQSPYQNNLQKSIYQTVVPADYSNHSHSHEGPPLSNQHFSNYNFKGKAIGARSPPRNSYENDIHPDKTQKHSDYLSESNTSDYPKYRTNRLRKSPSPHTRDVSKCQNISPSRSHYDYSEIKESNNYSNGKFRRIESSRRSRSLSPRKTSRYSKRSLSRSRHRQSISSRSRCSVSPKNKSHRSLSPRNRNYSPNFKKSSSKISEAYAEKYMKNEKDKVIEKWSSRGSSGDLEKNIFDLDADLEREKRVWTRTAPAELFYQPLQLSSVSSVVHGTEQLAKLCDEFEEELLNKSEKIRSELPKYEPLQRKKKVPLKKHKGHHGCGGGGGHSSSSSSNSSSESEPEDCITEELEHKKNHPLRLHPELWFNDPGEMNDGPLCRCSARARRSGIRHNIYAGEKLLVPCDPNSNNADRLHHYRITISPPTNFLVKTPTIIGHDAHEYIFEGFSMFSHKKLDALPLCKVIRFNIEYTIVYFEEKFPENFTIRELNIFSKYLFQELLELVDLDMRAHEDVNGCPQYHFMPRFVRELPGNGKEILCMNEVLGFLLQSYQPLISRDCLQDVLNLPQHDWQHFTESIKGMIVTYPGKKPCSLRVDQLDRDAEAKYNQNHPEIVHFGIRPPQLSYAGNTEYQKAWREYVKFRHLLANMPKPSFEDKRKLEAKEIRLQNMRTKSELKRNVTVTVSSENFYKTGIMCDVVQHAMLIPVLVSHLRFHRSLDVLEEKIGYKFQNRYILQLALTHPSYKENFGTNPDHARNSLTNCGIRQPVYGDRRIHYMNTRKRGINTLINIMSRFGKSEETESNITHNERLEFLGDAVVEFVTSVHLFHMFPDLEEGGLATYRAAIVQNQHLAVLAKKLGLEEFMLYAHGSDLCRDLELRHAMANCFEALMGALFLDGGIEVADKVFGKALFKDDVLLDVWINIPPHPLQEQEPLGDRKWISCFPLLQKLTKFEESIGIEFNHIRLLARAFTDRSIGYTNLTLGSNQRLEFLGDTVLQLIASEYLYKYFPEHHEGHLSLLRSSLVNNRTQAVVCNDLGMTVYAVYSNPKAELKTKDRADLLEAFLGALYVDKGLEDCQVFCSVCFFPRLQDFIMHQDWNDPKSKLQQCCLTLRTMEGGEPEIPVYKVIECMGPTNTRIYTVAVYFKGKRLAKASGHSIQQAEMNAAKRALKCSEELFPQLNHQKRVISKSMNRQNKPTTPPKSEQSRKGSIKQTGDDKRKSSNSGRSLNEKQSQRRRSKTPPLAYRRKNKSESPKPKDANKNQKDKNLNTNSKERHSNDHDNMSKSTSSIDKHMCNDHLKKDSEIQNTKDGEQAVQNKVLDKCKDKSTILGNRCRSPSTTQPLSEKSITRPPSNSRRTVNKRFERSKSRSSERNQNRSVSPKKKSSSRSTSCSSDKSSIKQSSKSTYSESTFSVPSKRRSRSTSPLNYRSKMRPIVNTRSPTRNCHRSNSPKNYRSRKYSPRRSRSRSPPRRIPRTKRSHSPSPLRSRKRSLSRDRMSSSKSRDRSSSRERRDLMDFMLGKQTTLNDKSVNRTNTASVLVDMMFKNSSSLNTCYPPGVSSTSNHILGHSNNKNQMQNYIPANPTNYVFTNQPCPYINIQQPPPFPNTGTNGFINMTPNIMPHWPDPSKPPGSFCQGPVNFSHNTNNPPFNPSTFNKNYH